MAKITKTSFVNDETRGLKKDEMVIVGKIARNAYDEEMSIHKAFLSNPSKKTKTTLKQKALKLKENYLKKLISSNSSKSYILSVQNLIELIKKDKLDNSQLQQLINFHIDI